MYIHPCLTYSSNWRELFQPKHKVFPPVRKIFSPQAIHLLAIGVSIFAEYYLRHWAEPEIHKTINDQL